MVYAGVRHGPRPRVGARDYPLCEFDTKMGAGEMRLPGQTPTSPKFSASDQWETQGEVLAGESFRR